MIGGLRLEEKKETTQISWTIRHFNPPSVVRIPLASGRDSSALPCVRIGDYVRTGQKIAESEDPLAVHVHASVSGKIVAIDWFPHPVLGTAKAIEIHSDGLDHKAPGLGEARQDWNHLSKESLLEILKGSGIVERDREGRPLSIQAFKKTGAKIHTLILNGCESEPYVTSGHALMMSHPVEILKGAEILRRVFEAERIVFATQENKLEVAELVKSKIYFLKWNHVEVSLLPSFYPQDAEVPLIHELFEADKRALLSGKETGVQVHSVVTAFAVYEAVVLQKPLYEKAVTVAGACVVEPKNVWLRIGTSFEDAIKTCRGLLREPEKVLMNGPMRGMAQPDLKIPVIQSTEAILALPKEVTLTKEIQPCIRCNRCVEACPSEISPVMITLAAEKDLFDIAKYWGLEFCIQCGNCSYVCPSKRPMMELIHYARSSFEPSGISDDFEGALKNLQKKKGSLAEKKSAIIS